MSLLDRSPADSSVEVPASSAARSARRSSSRPQPARAYCGEAHRHRWTVPGGLLPEVVELPVPAGTRRYRLVRHPRTGLPARDAHGALVFIPVRDPDTTW
jgi:hypothetical protein